MKQCRSKLLRVLSQPPPKKLSSTATRKPKRVHVTPTEEKVSSSTNNLDSQRLYERRKAPVAASVEQIARYKVPSPKDHIAVQQQMLKKDQQLVGGAPTASSSSSSTSSPLSAKQRRELLAEKLQDRSEAVLDVTEGGENDIDLGGLPLNQFHGKLSHLTIPQNSTLNKTIVNPQKNLFSSKQGKNSWNILGQQQSKEHRDQALLEEVRQRSTKEEWEKSDGHYQHTFSSSLNFEHHRESVQHSVSIYTKRKLYIDGLLGYHDFMTVAEEKEIAGELLTLLMHPSASAFIAEDSRYCVNLYEKRLGTQIGDPWAFPLSSAPRLWMVLERAFSAGLIPSLPNAVQVSEFIGPTSGYPLHLKHASLGRYFGILNLVTKAPLCLQHIDVIWAPKVMLMPRALYIVQQPCLTQYKIGYKKQNEANGADLFSTFQGKSRQTLDYRIEAMFATIDAPSVPALSGAIRVTEASETRTKRNDSKPF